MGNGTIIENGRRRLPPLIPHQPNLDHGPSGVCPSRLDRERELQQEVDKIGTEEKVADVLDEGEQGDD